IRLLDQISPDKSVSADGNSISGYIIKIARLGGYLARASDNPPETWSCGAAGRDSPTSNLALYQEQNLWVIESFTGGLRR
ncbi:MAG: hypothetical protein P8Y71_26840, partial [Pseudolabrys sp.]